MTPYENVQIGNFLIALGYALNDLKRPLYGSINLFQQTPTDKTTGDVFGVLNGRYFILEFKRDSNHLHKELDKEARIKLEESLNAHSNSLLSVSMKAHLMVYPSWFEKQLKYHVQPYLTAIRRASVSFENSFEHISSPQDFVKEIYNSQSELGCGFEEISEYVKLLATCSSSKGSAGSGGNICGLIQCIDPIDKGIQFYQFQSLDDLGLVLQRTMTLEIENKLAKEKTMNIKKGLDRGWGM